MPSLANAFSASVVGLLFGAVAGWGVEFLGFYVLLAAVAYGAFAGEMILRAANRKRGSIMEMIAGIALAIGAVGGRIVVAALVVRSGGPHPAWGVFDVVARLVVPTPIPLISLGIMVASAVARIRYI